MPATSPKLDNKDLSHDILLREPRLSLSSSSTQVDEYDEIDSKGSRSEKQPHLVAEGRDKLIQASVDLDEDADEPVAAVLAADASSKSPEKPVTWMSLPKKGQLAVLVIARLSEPLSERSLAAYMFYQLKWFSPESPDSVITSQGGILVAAFAAAQFFTAVWWGRAADTPWIGRKKVILVGLVGAAIASLGVGYSTSFYQAVFFRALAGALNGNIGVMRTMISEIIREKKYQSRAFLLLPMCFNIGVIIGPVIGGFLADPIHSFPDIFGPGSTLGGKNGVGWMNAFPYALPNLFSGIFILLSAISVIFGLDETHEALRNKQDYGRRMGKFFASKVCGRGRNYDEYTQVATGDYELHAPSADPGSSSSQVWPRTTDPEHGEQSNRRIALSDDRSGSLSKKSPFRQILTRNVVLTLVSHHLLAFHVSSFNALSILLLPAPYNRNTDWHFPSLLFTGGLGLSQSRVGLAMLMLGVIGLVIQLVVYPDVIAKLGTLPAYRTFLPFSILAYIALPFLSLLPQSPVWLTWVLLALVLASQVLSRTFALTGTVILVNNSSPDPAVLGTVHGFAQSASSAARMLGPTVGGALLGLGLRSNFVGGIWWLMAIIAACNWGLLFCIYEGDGQGGRA